MIKVKESEFQRQLKVELRERFPDCYILKIDGNVIQGFPDLLILYKNKWAALELKKSNNASHRPNQDYYVKLLNEMSFASFISPETKEVVMNAMEQALES